MSGITIASITVFVYGTLMRGEYNHGLLADDRFLGEAATAPEFTLINLGAYPALVDDGTTSVKGEVYEVNAKTLADLDRLEGHPIFYRRRMITLADSRRALAYLMPAEKMVGRPLIEHGDWRLHRKELDK